MQLQILRICDANCNRAREALRVLEDYARFTLNHSGLSGQLKQLRHDFQIATADLQRRAVSARDTSADVGKDITTETEQERESLAAVVTAAGKRLGEALRTIEEYMKISPSSIETEGESRHDGSTALGETEGSASPSPSPTLNSGGIEAIRYRFYDIEKSILLTLSPGRQRMRDVRLYVLITESICRRPWLEVAEAAIAGGADCIQLREKDLSGQELLRRAVKLVELCRANNKICIINDRADIAILSGAHGVHVGQDDLPAREIRKLVGPDMIVGVSTDAIEQAQQAVLDGADYIGVGPIFPSLTKPRPNITGLSYAQAVALSIQLPSVAISGINVENTPALLRTGLRAIAVSSAVIVADDPEAVARQLKALLMQ